jgi:hypothetical protein
MTADEFSVAYGENAVDALRLFMLGLGDVEGHGKSTIEMLPEMGITEVRLRDSLLRAASAGDLLTDAIALSNLAWEENTALANEAAERYNTLSNRFQVFKNNVDDLKIEIFEGIQDTLKEIVALGTGYVQELSSAFKEGGVDGLLDAAGNVIADIVGRIASALPQIISVVADIMIKVADAVSKNAPLIISGLLNAVSQLAPAVANVGIQLVLGIVKGIISSIPTIVNAAFDIVKGLANGIGNASRYSNRSRRLYQV